MSMEDNGSPSLGFRLDIKQILSEAQHRWLRPAEICEILRNHPKFHISPEPPHKPVSGSVFLFDRKALRYFRKDSHNWRKKRDGKTVKEAHEKLKVGSVDMLHCYYAHGEEDENFQRRSYWLLEQDLMHIVFVHYLEVKGSKTYNSYNRNVESASNTVSFSFPENRNIVASPSTDSTSPTSTLTSAYEDAAESEPNDQANSGFQSPDSSVTAQGQYHMPSYSGDVYIPVMDYASAPYQSSFTHGTQKTVDMTPWEDVFAHSTTGGNVIGQNSIGNSSLVPNNDLSYNNSEKSFFEQKLLSENLQSIVDSYYTDPQVEDEQEGLSNGMKCNYSRILQQSLVSGGSHVEEGLKKVDSFSKWVAKELVDELAIQSNCDISWSALENDICALNPSLSQDQLFSISNISPTWGYTNCETEVRINGTFLKYEQELVNIRWSCMFGEIEVPVEVLKDGILKCYAPRHRDGIFPIYITCSNRSACSEVREFEYRVGPVQDSATIEMNLRNRLEKLLSSSNHPVSFGSIGESKEESVNRVKDMFYSWIFKKVNESEKGAAILDQEGQGVLHLAAALGFNWVFQQVIVSGVSIDFRDVNGWTALHWAAFYGREETVACLVSLGAGPGALTDPTAEFPMGRTPADLASSNGHKGISGFLAESSLTTHLVSLTVNDEKKEEGIQTVSERAPIKITEYDAPDALSLRDSLVAVCNATQAATRIHQIFRIQSFQRKQFISDENDEEGIPFRGLRNSRFGQVQGSNNGVVHTAATCIQKKYRGWKKRQEFLLIRQRIVKIQAHVRGHQARKKHKPITWSVGILEKIILRWRRKGRGLRGIQQENNNTVANNEEEIATVEDDFDVLKQGRKQTEERLIKALARVKSMSSNPEARAQYRRLLTVAEEIREPKEVSSDMILQGSEDMSYYPEDELFDVESLFGEDTLMTFF